MKTPLNKVRGLGSAKEGVEHFWHQRVSAIALVPLVLWFLWTVPTHVGADYETVRAWIAGPLTAIPLLLFIAVAFYHMKLGLQTVIEDYISGHGLKIVLLVLSTFFSYGLAAASAFAVLQISLG